MKWIKASERKPEVDCSLIIRNTKNNTHSFGSFDIELEETESIFEEGDEWLDESDNSDLTAAREEGRREGAIWFLQFTAVLGLDYFVEHKSGMAILYNGSNIYTLDQAYDLYRQSFQKDKP